MKRILILMLIAAIAAGPGAAQTKKAEKPIRFSLSAAYAGLSIADTATTIYGTRRGLIESNKLFRQLFEKHQYAAIWAIQITATAFAVIVSNLAIVNGDRTARWICYGVLIVGVALRAYAVVHNARLNRGLR